MGVGGFYFRAEDGIRGGTVTGVQTCALPICAIGMAGDDRVFVGAGDGDGDGLQRGAAVAVRNRDVVLLGQRLAGLQIISGAVGHLEAPANRAAIAGVDARAVEREAAEIAGGLRREGRRIDRKSTRLDSSDGAAAYAVVGMEDDVLGERAIGMAGEDRVGVG